MSMEDSYIMGIKFRNVMAELLRSEMAPIVEKLNRLDERQSRLEYHLSQPSLHVHGMPPLRGLLGSAGVSSSFPDKLRGIVKAPVKYAADDRCEVEYKVPGVKLAEKKPGEIPRKRGNWYPATIVKDRGDNTYDVLYVDGEKEIRVQHNLIRPFNGYGDQRDSSDSALGGRSKASKDYLAIEAELKADDTTYADEPVPEYKEAASPVESYRKPVVQEEKSPSPRPAAAPDVAPIATSEETKAGGPADNAHGEGVEDNEMVAAGGDESGCVKPWLGAVKPPTKPPVINSDAPSETLLIKWVHGYTSASSGKYAVSNNLFYNKDGEVVFPAAALGIKIRKNEDGEVTQTFFQMHDDDILCLAVSKCRRFAATGQTASHTSKGKAHVCIWDAVNMSLLTKLEGCHFRGVLNLSFSPDSTKLLTVGLDDDSSHIIFGSSNGWKKVDKVSEDKGDKANFIYSAWVNPANPICTATGGFNMVSLSTANVHLWSVDGAKLSRQKGSLSKKVAAANVKVLCAANFNTKDGWRVAMGGANGDIFMFDGKDAGASIPTAHAKDVISLAEAGAACIFLVSGGVDKTIKVWNGTDLTMVSSYDISGFAKVDGTVGSLDVRPDLSAIICGTYGGEVIEITPSAPCSSTIDLTVASGFVLQYSHFRGELWGLAMHPTNSDIVATVGDDSTLRLWSISKNKLLSTTNIGWPGRALDFHPSGGAIAIGLMEWVKGGIDKGAKDKGKKGSEGGGTKGSVMIYSIQLDGEEIKVEMIATGCPSVAWINEVRFSPTGHMLAVGSHDKKLYLYKVNPDAWADTLRKEKYIFNKHSSAVLHIDFSADSKYIQTTCQSGELIFSDTKTGKQETSATKMAEYHGTDGKCASGDIYVSFCASFTIIFWGGYRHPGEQIFCFSDMRAWLDCARYLPAWFRHR